MLQERTTLARRSNGTSLSHICILTAYMLYISPMRKSCIRSRFSQRPNAHASRALLRVVLELADTAARLANARAPAISTICAYACTSLSLPSPPSRRAEIL